MSKIGPRFKYLEQPIFCLCVLKDYVLVASGGGGKKFGVRNKIVSYRIQDNKFSDEVCHSVEFEKEIPVFISACEKAYMFCTCIDNMTVFYILNTSTGVFTELHRLTVSDFFDADVYQSVCRLDSQAAHFASGTTDGVLNFSQGVAVPSLLKESQAHLKGINDILFIEGKNMVVTAGADGLCKIFETSSLKLLKKLAFKQREEEKNYSIRGLKYDNVSGYLFTIQAPMRGHTYLTKWDIANGFAPVVTIEVSDSICTSIDYSPYYELLGLADCKGSLIYVSASSMTKLKEIPVSEITIKSVAFKDGNLISGAADNALAINYIYKASPLSFSSVIKILFVLLYGYYIYTKLKGNKTN